jgi:hypothetical protein
MIKRIQFTFSVDAPPGAFLATLGLPPPACEIARFADITIVGLNNDGFQIQRARKYTKRACLEGQITCSAKGDFMKLPEQGDAVDGKGKLSRALGLMTPAPRLAVFPMQTEPESSNTFMFPNMPESAEFGRMRTESVQSRISGDDFASSIMIA